MFSNKITFLGRQRPSMKNYLKKAHPPIETQKITTSLGNTQKEKMHHPCEHLRQHYLAEISAMHQERKYFVFQSGPKGFTNEIKHVMIPCTGLTDSQGEVDLNTPNL